MIAVYDTVKEPESIITASRMVKNLREKGRAREGKSLIGPDLIPSRTSHNYQYVLFSLSLWRETNTLLLQQDSNRISKTTMAEFSSSRLHTETHG